MSSIQTMRILCCSAALTIIAMPDASFARSSVNSGERDLLCGYPPQDKDYDGDVDLDDLYEFEQCLLGPSLPADLSCMCLDFSTNGHIDLPDFARFMEVFGWNMCQVANPSFEIPGQNGNVFGGWYQHNNVSASDELTSHGNVAVKVIGPLERDFDISAVWQRLDTSSNALWEARVCVGHSSTSPLTGDSKAIVNVEWFSALKRIGYESHTVADASTPTDVMTTAFVQFGLPLPGTKKLRLVLGVAQDSTQPPATVFFDLVEFNTSGVQERQWDDFGTERVIEFSGRNWRVKGIPDQLFDPGNTYYGTTEDHVWVDTNGIHDRLHLTVRKQGNAWYSTEVALEEALGYGDYIVTTIGPLDAWETNVVLGMFLYQYTPCWRSQDMWWNPNNEMDIEFTHWDGSGSTDIGQFAVQPHDFDDFHSDRFPISGETGELISHAIHWLPDHVEFRSWHGGPDDEPRDTAIHTWTYPPPTQPPFHVARPELPRMHINFYRPANAPEPPPTWIDHEIIIDEFRFNPAPYDRCSAPSR